MPDIAAMWRAALADPRWSTGLRVLLDHTNADASVLTAREIEQRAMTVRAMVEEIGCQKIALVLPDEASFSVWMLEALVLDREVGFRARGFTSLTEARNWLLLPPEASPAHAAPRPSA